MSSLLVPLLCTISSSFVDSYCFVLSFPLVCVDSFAIFSLYKFFSGGHFCGTPGSPDVDGECLAGHYCTSGVDTATPTDSVAHKGTGAECPTGHYCPKGSAVPLPCTAGTYALVTGL